MKAWKKEGKLTNYDSTDPHKQAPPPESEGEEEVPASGPLFSALSCF